MIYKKKYLIFFLIFLIIFFIFSFYFIQNARVERSWPFNSKLGKYLPKSAKYFAYKYTNPENLILETFYYKIKSNYFSIPSTNATGNGGGVSLLKNNLVLTILDTGEIFLFDHKNNSFQIIESKVLLNKYISIRDIDVFENELIVIAVKEINNECQSLELSTYNINIKENKNLKIKFKEKLWESEPVCEDPLANNGGARVINFNNKYYVSTGYFTTMSLNINPLSQSKSSSFGKILEFDKNGNKIIFSVGHRNPQGLFTYNNYILSTEHGPRGGDEINLIKKNNNYGWPCKTLGTLYSYEFTALDDDMWPNKEVLKGNGCNENLIFSDPLYSWTPSINDGPIAPSQGFHYKGDYFKKYKNNIIIGSLAATSLFRMVLSDELKIINIERININERIRDLMELDDGKILIYTDGGSLIVLTKVINND